VIKTIRIFLPDLGKHMEEAQSGPQGELSALVYLVISMFFFSSSFITKNVYTVSPIGLIQAPPVTSIVI